MEDLSQSLSYLGKPSHGPQRITDGNKTKFSFKKQLRVCVPACSILA